MLMGILKNYEVVNPIVSATTDAFNRLRPGFEAPYLYRNESWPQL